jgi:hypothetical protein
MGSLALAVEESVTGALAEVSAMFGSGQLFSVNVTTHVDPFVYQ